MKQLSKICQAVQLAEERIERQIRAIQACKPELAEASRQKIIQFQFQAPFPVGSELTIIEADSYHLFLKLRLNCLKRIESVLFSACKGRLKGRALSNAQMLDFPIGETEKPPTGAIVTPPGYRLLDWLPCVVGKKTMKSIVEPGIADMQHEYFEALKAKKPFLAKYVKWRGYASLVLALKLHVLLSLVSKVWKIMKAAG